MPSTAPSARRSGWVGSSPRHHGQGSTSPGEPAGEVRSPRTFSTTRRQGRRASTARATCSQSPDRVSEFSPARRPATETSLTGEAGREDTDLRNVGPVDRRDVTQVRHPGPVPGEDRGRCGVDFGVPGETAAQCGLDTEVESAVPTAQRSDQRGARGVRGHSRHRWTRRAVGAVVGACGVGDRAGKALLPDRDSAALSRSDAGPGSLVVANRLARSGAGSGRSPVR